MFGNKNKTNTGPEDVLTAKINQDMVVRNMPSLAKISGPSSVSAKSASITESNNLSNFSPPKHSPKMVGLIIIVGGLIFIGVLVYLSFQYIIKPQTKKNEAPIIVNTPDKPSIVNSPRATTSAEINVATTSLIATVTPEIIELASSSASTTVSLDQVGRPNIDLPPLLDSDSDGLYDEEELVLGTSASSSDSNGNTYLDLVEIRNNYNPAASGKLAENAGLAKYASKAYKYEILYPKEWPLNSLSGDAIITFTLPDDSIFQVSVQENLERQSILGWYGNSFPDITITYDKLKTTENWDGIYSSDNLNFYLTDKKRNSVYIITYVPSVDGRLVYPNIFEMMVNSFQLK